MKDTTTKRKREPRKRYLYSLDAESINLISALAIDHKISKSQVVERAAKHYVICRSPTLLLDFETLEQFKKLGEASIELLRTMAKHPEIVAAIISTTAEVQTENRI